LCKSLLTLGLDECGYTSSSNGRDQRVSLLVNIDVSVPTAPDLGGSEHATTSTHVTESTLARAVSTTTADTRNTGYGTSGTP